MDKLKLAGYIGSENKLLLVFDLNGKQYAWNFAELESLAGKGLHGKLNINWEVNKIEKEVVQ